MVIAAIVAVVVQLRGDPSPPRSPHTKTSGPTSTCRVRLDAEEPPLPPAALEDPSSRLPIRARLPLQAIARAIEGRVPTQLAAASGRSIGVAGEASYTVTRGPVALTLEDERLWARVPIGADVEVCKPLGPICAGYGGCSPKLAVAYGVPLMLDRMQGGTESRLSVAEGCSIVGFDVTGRLVEQATRQVAGVKAQIDAALPTPERMAQLALPAGFELADGCLAMLPTAIVQAPPRADEDLHLALDVEADLRWAPSCPPPGGPPPVARGAAADGGALEVDAGAMATKVLEAIGEAVAASRWSAVDGGALVARLDFEGEVCGSAWLALRPRVEDRRLRFAPRWLTEPPPDAGPILAAVRDVAEPIPRRAEILVEALASLDRQLAPQLDATAALPVVASLDGPAAAVTPRVGPEGIVLRVRRALTLRLASR